MVGIVLREWPHPEGRPSHFFGITNKFEAVYYDFCVLTEIIEEERRARDPRTAKDKFQASLSRMPASMRDRTKRRLEKQRQKRNKVEPPDNIDESDV
jgi:hypothetical protein